MVVLYEIFYRIPVEMNHADQQSSAVVKCIVQHVGIWQKHLFFHPEMFIQFVFVVLEEVADDVKGGVRVVVVLQQDGQALFDFRESLADIVPVRAFDVVGQHGYRVFHEWFRIPFPEVGVCVKYVRKEHGVLDVQQVEQMFCRCPGQSIPIQHVRFSRKLIPVITGSVFA